MILLLVIVPLPINRNYRKSALRPDQTRPDGAEYKVKGVLGRSCPSLYRHDCWSSGAGPSQWRVETHSGLQLLGRSGLSNPTMDQGEMELFRIQTEVYRRALEARETLESFSQSMAIEQRVEMYVLVLVAICLCILFKILNVNNSPEKSLFYCSNQKFLEEFLKKAPELAEPYIPTRFWGYSGHLQTIIQVSVRL